MGGEELTRVRNTQAEIARRLKLEQEIQEHSLKGEKAYLLIATFLVIPNHCAHDRAEGLK